MQRDFTYVDDVVEAIVRLVDRAPIANPQWSADTPDPGSSSAPWRVYNIGNNRPIQILKVVEIMEKELGRSAQKDLVPMHAGDGPATYADVDDLMRDVGFKPSMPIEEGIRRFLNWYREYSAAR
jgi:UDP-glucuronate 4-epimerase